LIAYKTGLACIVLWFFSIPLESQISYDSCKILLSTYQFEELQAELVPGSFEYYFFNAKLYRRDAEYIKAVENINKALEFFDQGEISLKYADALDEYGVIQRHSLNSIDKILASHYQSVTIRTQLRDTLGLGLTNLYLGNAYMSGSDSIIDRDSSFYYYHLATDLLKDSDPHLSTLIKHNLATAYLDVKDYESSEKLFTEAKNYCDQNGLLDLGVSCGLGLSDLYMKKGDYQQSEQILKSIESDSIFHDDLSYRGQLFRSYADLYRETNQYAKAFEMQDSSEAVVHRRFEKIELDAAEKYESQRYKNQLIEEDLISTRRMWIALSLGLTLIASLIGFLFYNRSRRQQYLLKEKDLLLQKQQALEDERNRIAAEMHDDLGGGLTTIKFVSQRARRKMDNPRDQALLDKIIDQSNSLVTNMSEIIWAMNSKFDNLSSTVAYIRRYSMEYLSDFEIDLAFGSDQVHDDISLTSTVRRNLLLIVKEALNNIAKHAHATQVSIEISYVNHNLILAISDNGIGLQSENILGNGLENMQDRVEQMGGEIEYRDAEPGLTLICQIPMNKNSKLNQNQTMI